MKKFLLVIIGCVGLLVLFLLDQWLLQDFESKMELNLQTLTQTSRIRLENSIQSRFNAVNALEALFLVQPQTQEEEFGRFAQSLLENNPPVRALQYADSTTRVTYVYPSTGNEITIASPMVLIKDPQRGPYVQKAIKTGRPTLQGPFVLRQGGLGVVVRDPLFEGNQFMGLAIGVYDVPALLKEALGEIEQDGVVFRLTDAQGQGFFGPEEMPDGGCSQQVSVLDQTWTMTSHWAGKATPPQLPRILTWLFGVGGLVAMLISLHLSWQQTKRLERTVRERTRELEEANLALARDMEEIQRMEKQLLHAHRMRSIGTLSGGIAHEFNNLLSIILGNAELVMEDIPQDKEARLFLEDILAACARGKKVVQHILRFSRKTPSGKTQLDIIPIIRQALKLLKDTIAKNIEFKESFSAGDGWVLGDSKEIQQVAIQLATNAVQALEKDGGTVSLTIYTKEFLTPKGVFGQDLPPGKYVCLEVRDNGSGIAPQDMDRIFEPYFTTRGFGRNLGMGLSVVQGILLGHGGGIEMNSVAGQGTVARCFFPAAEIEREEVDADFAAIAGGKEHILYVDDEAALARINKVRLERLGYTVNETTDPRKALSMVENTPTLFDLVITDLTMPGMQGDQLIRNVRKIRPDLKCILCSGYNDAVTGESVHEIGADGWLAKPIKGLDLARAVRAVLDSK